MAGGLFNAGVTGKIAANNVDGMIAASEVETEPWESYLAWEMFCDNGEAFVSAETGNEYCVSHFPEKTCEDIPIIKEVVSSVRNTNKQYCSEWE